LCSSFSHVGYSNPVVARFYLFMWNLHRLLPALHAHLPCTTLLNSEVCALFEKKEKRNHVVCSLLKPTSLHIRTNQCHLTGDDELSCILHSGAAPLVFRLESASATTNERSVGEGDSYSDISTVLRTVVTGICLFTTLRVTVAVFTS